MEPRRELTAIESALAADVARLTAENAALQEVLQELVTAADYCTERDIDVLTWYCSWYKARAALAKARGQ